MNPHYISITLAQSSFCIFRVYLSSLLRSFLFFLNSQFFINIFVCFLYLLSVCSYHVTYAFQSESKLYSCLNVKELLARSRHEIRSLSDCNWTRINNYLVHKRTLNHLAKLVQTGQFG